MRCSGGDTASARWRDRFRIRSPARSQITVSRGLVVSGLEYSGWAWST